MTAGEDLAARMQCEAVARYRETLRHKRGFFAAKRAFDVVASGAMLLLLSPVLLGLAAAVKLDSPGPVFYRQVRMTKNAREFRIFKFRSMVTDADRMGPLVTVGEDPRITRVGRFLRGTRLDELPQLLNILVGDMTFVGTRPEVRKYVEQYTDEMLATLLLRAGVTSRASIAYRDEAALLEAADDPDRVYVETILPEKMKYNLQYLERASVREDVAILIDTVRAVSGD